MPRRIPRAPFLAAALLLSGCADLPYLSQAAWGQLTLLSQARPIPTVLNDPVTSAEVRRKLLLAQDVRRYAVTELGLPEQSAFTTYVQLKRGSVSWSVVAAPEFSLAQRTWCFPIAGCVTYRGYFNEAAARTEAASLRAAGNDVDVQAVPAYSTLGYLPDPLLSTTVEQGSDLTLIRLLIHELSHPAVYAPGDTTFNESYATTVELEGTRRWLDTHGTPEQRAEFTRDQTLEQDSVTARAAARTALQALYARPLAPDAMRAEKTRIFETLRVTLNDALERAGFAGRWPDGRLNNANLGQAGAYTTLVPAFQALLGAKSGNVPGFIQAARACAAQPPPQRPACLAGP